MHRLLRRTPLAHVSLLGLALAGGIWLPIPSAGNAALSDVVGQVRAHLPGWNIRRATASWEGAYTVVASCGSRQIGFQLVPEHGLPVGDAWIQPNDPYARSRLAPLSDNETYLVWFRNAEPKRSLSCREELARHAPGAGVD
jgi:hypothetical protein